MHLKDPLRRLQGQKMKIESVHKTQFSLQTLKKFLLKSHHDSVGVFQNKQFILRTIHYQTAMILNAAIIIWILNNWKKIFYRNSIEIRKNDKFLSLLYQNFNANPTTF